MNGMIFYHLNMYDVKAVVEYSKNTRHKLYLPKEHPYFAGEVKNYGFDNWWDSVVYRVKDHAKSIRQNKYYAFDVLKRRLFRIVYRLELDETQLLIRKMVAMKKTDFLKLKEDLKLDYVLIPSDGYPWLQNFIGWCKEEGVEVVVLRKEGIPFPLLVPEEIEFPFIGDYLCVVGPIQQRIWQKQGVPEDRLFVCGYPRMDYYRQPERWPKRGDVLRKYGLDPAKKTVLYPAQNPIPDNIGCNFVRLKRETLRELFRFVRKNKDVQVIIKPHKKQSMALTFWELIARSGVVKRYRLVHDEVDIRELIVSVDLIVAGNSTTIMEGMVIGKPTVLTRWDEADKPGLLEYYEWHASPAALSKKELVPLVQKLLAAGSAPEEYAEGREKLVYEYIYKQDGKVCQRIFEVLDLIEAGIAAAKPNRA